MLIRFVAWGILGWCVEILFTAAKGVISGSGRWRLTGTTYLWMFPIYGLIGPVYEPMHDALRDPVPLPVRALVYGIAFMGVEYASGWLLRRTTGACPWDYAGRARFHIHGLVRIDYLPFWMALGVALEPVHDFLVRLTPAIRQALG